jgi:hypothetical protein
VYGHGDHHRKVVLGEERKLRLFGRNVHLDIYRAEGKRVLQLKYQKYGALYKYEYTQDGVWKPFIFDSAVLHILFQPHYLYHCLLPNCEAFQPRKKYILRNFHGTEKETIQLDIQPNYGDLLHRNRALLYVLRAAVDLQFQFDQYDTFSVLESDGLYSFVQTLVRDADSGGCFSSDSKPTDAAFNLRFHQDDGSLLGLPTGFHLLLPLRDHL